jgi:hypothetical protein
MAKKKLITPEEMELQLSKTEAAMRSDRFNTPSALPLNVPAVGVGRYFPNDSSYDEDITNFDLQRGLNAYRDEKQSDVLALGNSLLHGGLAFGSSMALSNPYGLAIYGGASLLQAGINLEDDNENNDNPLAWLSDNLATNVLGAIQGGLTDMTPVYDTTDQGVYENISPFSLKGVDNISQLVGYLAGGVYGAKNAAKMLGKGSSFYDSLLSLKGGNKTLAGLTAAEAASQGLSAVDDIEKLRKAKKFADGISGFSASLVGRVGETALESQGTKEEVLRNGGSEEDASRAAAFNFAANMALSLPDYYQNIKMLGTFDNILSKGLSQYSDESVDLYKLGEKTVGKYDSYLNIANALVKNGILEGAEEGVQYASNKGAQTTVENKEGWKGFMKNMGKEFGNSFLTEEGQISWILGAIAGGGASALATRGKSKMDQQDLDSIYKEANLIKKDIDENYVINETALYKTVELPDGTKQNIIKEDYINTINDNSKLESIKEYAVGKNDKNLYEIANNKQILNQALFHLSIDNFDNFKTELETSRDVSPEELKAYKALQTNSKLSEVTLTDKDLELHKRQIDNALSLVDNFKVTYNAMKELPQFRNISNPAMFKLGSIINSQKAIQKQLESFNPLVKINEPELITYNSDPILAAKEKKDAITYQELFKANELLLKEYEKYVANPKLLEEEIVKEYQENVKKQIKDSNDNKLKVSALESQLESLTRNEETAESNYEILLPNGDRVDILKAEDNSTVFIDKDGNDVTENFYNKNPNAKIVEKGTSELLKLKVTDVDLDDSQEAPEGTVRDEFKFKKPTLFSSSGRSSLGKDEFNDLGDRRDLNINPSRKLYFDTLAELSNSDVPLSLKLEVAPQTFEGITYPTTIRGVTYKTPPIIAVLYKNGKVVEKDGVRAYTVLNEANNANVKANEQEKLDYNKFIDNVKDREEQGLESYVTVESISPGFLNLKKDLMEEPLSTLKDIPAVTAGGYKLAVSMIDPVTGIPVIEHNGQKVNVKWSGRPYIAILTGTNNGKSQYVYHELQTRNLSAFEVDNIILPLIKEYLEGNRVKKIAGKEVSILSYDPNVYSVLDMFLFFGNSSNSKTSMKFEKQGDTEVLYFASGENNTKLFVTKDTFEGSIDLLRNALLAKKRTVSNKHLGNFLGERNLPILKNGSWSMSKTTYADLMLYGIPSAFPPAVYHNISTLDKNNIFLNKYAIFNPKIEEKPNTKVKAILKATPKPVIVIPTEEEKSKIINGEVNAFQFITLTSEQKDEYRESGKNILPVPEHLKFINKLYGNYLIKFENGEIQGDRMNLLSFVKSNAETIPFYQEVLDLSKGGPVFSAPVVEEKIVQAPEIVVETTVETVDEKPTVQAPSATKKPNPFQKQKPLTRKVDSLPYKLGDIESAKKWTQAKLGITPEVAEGLIKLAGFKGDYFGYFKNGAITLSDVLEEGTEYHEAFHLVSQMYLSRTERDSLYDEARKVSGKDMTDLEAEEYLAEKFRDYVMSDGKLAFPTKQQSLFGRLWNFIKSFLNLNTATVNEVFGKLNDGYYNKASYINRLGRGSKDLTLFSTFEISPSENRKIDEALLSYFRLFISQKGVNFADFELADSLPEFNTYVKAEMSKYNSAFNLKPDEFLNTFKEKTLTDLGFEFEEDEENSDNNVRNRGENYAESNKLSGFTGMSKKIDFLLNTVVDQTADYNEYGHQPLIPASEVKAYLANLLSDTFTFAEMMDKFNEIYDSEPTTEFEGRNWGLIGQIKESLGDMNSTANQVFLHTQFFDALSLVYQTMLTQIYYGNNSNVVLDSMKESIKNRIRQVWRTGLMSTDIVETVDGQRFIRNYSELQKLPAKEFAEKVGMKFNAPFDSNLENLISNFKEAIGILPKKIVVIDGQTLSVTTPFWYESSLEEAISVRDKSSKQAVAKWRNALNNLIEADIETTNSITENQSRNTENETVYAFAKPSFLFQKLAAIKKGLAKTITTQNSKLWDAIAQGKVNVTLVDGQKFNEIGSEGQHISTLTEEELLMHKIIGLYGDKNKYPTVQFMQMADKKSVYGLTINDKSLIVKPDEVTINDDYLEVPDSLINRLFDIYLNYKEFDNVFEEKGINKKFKVTKAASIFDELGDFSTKEEFSNAIKKELYKAYLDAMELTRNYVGTDKTGKDYTVLGNLVNDSITINKIVGALVSTEFVTNLEQMNIFFGNPAFYKDLFKRTPAIRANGRIPSIDSNVNDFIVDSRKQFYGDYEKNLPTDSTLFKGLVFSDVEVESKYNADYVKSLDVTGYDKVNATDAQGFSTFQFYREYMIRTGQWNAKLEKQFIAEMQGNSLSDSAWPPLKLVHFGPEASYTEEFIPVYYKFAVYPLVPSLIKGRVLEQTNLKMLESGSSIGVFESGNKVGTLINKSDYYGEVNENSIHTLNIQDLKIQVDISPKKNKWEVLFGSQIRKLITQNAVNAGKEFKNEKDYNEFLKLINDLVEIESANLAESLGVSLDRLREGDLDRDAWGKLIDIFKQSAIEREESDNVIYGLDYLKSQELTIDALPSRNKIQNLMNALLNNRILKQKMFGRSYVQTSSVGFEYATEESLSKALRNGDILEDSEFYKSHFVNKKFDNTKARLGFVNKVDDEIYVAEILLPNWFKGKFNINTLDSNLLESLGYRIPTQGLNSMLSFKVVGFLPKNTDLLAAVPYEITVQSGGDFDVDKLNMFLYNYITDMSEEKIKEYNKIKNTITDDEILDLFIKNNEKPLPIPLGGDLGRRFEKKRLQNKLLTLLIKRLKDPERFVDYVTPNSAENLQKQAQEINNAQQEKYKVTVDYKGIKQFWTGTNVRVGKNFWSAKAGVGQSASQSVFAALTQISPLVQKVYSNRLFVPKGYLNLNEDNKIILGKKNNTEGKSIIDLIGNQHLSANVDAAKTPFIFQLNANGKTNDIHYYLLEAGIPDKWVNRFMTQPIILEFIKKTAENKGLVSKYRRVNLAENKTKNDIILEVRKMFGGEGVDSEYLKANVDFNGKRIPTANPEGRIYDEEQLLSFIKKPINSSQLNILDDYLFYTEYAMDLRKAINSLKFDTQGAGKNLPESMIYDYNYKKLNDNIFDGIYTLVDKTIIRPFKVNVLDTAIALYKPSVAVHKIFNSDIALKSLMNILDKNSQLKSESLYKIYGMLTNIIIQNNLQNKKEWFDNNVYGDNSVSKQISKLIKSDEMKGNYLFDNMLIVDFAQTQGKPDIVRFDNTIRIDNNLDKVINESFRDFKFKHPALYTDLIKLSLFQTGVIESPVSFYKYIPVEDFVEVVGNLTKNSLVEYPDMIEKVIQNLPTLKGLANKISYSKILEGRIGLPDYLEIQYNNNPESYITKFDFKLNELGLYKLNSINEESLSYYRIPITGASNLYNGIIGDDVDVKAKFDNEEETDTQEETERPTSELFKQNNIEEFKGFWTREQVAKQTDKVFLFGDNTNDRLNTKYIPSSTQAVIRELSNAIGIDTKKDRATNNSSYFTNADFNIFKQQVDEAIQKAKNSGKTIVIPADGIGTGKAMLKEKAPKLFGYLQQELDNLKKQKTTLQQKELTWDSLLEDDKFGIERAGISPEEFEDMSEDVKKITIKCYGKN